MKFYVYTITHAGTGKKYVGQSRHPETRFAEHMENARAGERSALYAAMREFGPTAFSFDLVGEYDSLNAALMVERALIVTLDTTRPDRGYNRNAGHQLADRPAYVYCIKNARNGKRYVGITQDVVARMDGHRTSARKGSLLPLHKDMRRDGFDAFTVSVLRECEDRFDAEDAEAEAIVRLRLTDPSVGYNKIVARSAPSVAPEERARLDEIAALSAEQRIDRKSGRIGVTASMEAALHLAGIPQHFLVPRCPWIRAFGADRHRIKQALVAARQRPRGVVGWM